MLESSAEEKQKYLDDLGKFVNDAENYMKDLCSSVGWDYNSLNNYGETENYVICPFNNGHRVPERTMHKHLVKCEWKALGYTEECKPFPEPVLPPDDPSTIKIDMQLQAKVLRDAKLKNPELNISLDEKFIPQTSDRLTSDFSSDEKKVIYEYAIANTVGPDIGYDITEMNKPEKTNDNETERTPIEMLLAQERNLKRRRARHRGVHTNKKSHIEIMRELVQNQMEMYREHLSEKYGIPILNEDEKSKLGIHEEEQDKNYEDKLDENAEQLLHSKQDRKNLDDGDQSIYKSKYNSKGPNQKPEKERVNDRDHSSSGRHSSHHRNYDYKNTNKRDSESSSRRHQHYDTWDKHRDEYDSHERSRDKHDSRGKHRDTYEFRSKDKDRYDSRDRSRDKYDSRYKDKDKYESQNSKKDKNKPRDSSKDNKHDSCEKDQEIYAIRFKSKDDYNSQNTIKDNCNKHDLDQNEYGVHSKKDDRDESMGKTETKSIVLLPHSRKRERSKSSERDFTQVPEHEAKEKSSRKKHKKEHKHAKDKSRDKVDDKKHKKSKRKRDRDRSQS